MSHLHSNDIHQFEPLPELEATDGEPCPEYRQFIEEATFNNEEEVKVAVNQIKKWFYLDEHWYARDLIEKMEAV